MEIRKFELKANDKLEEQRKRFHDDRVDLHAQVDTLVERNDALLKKLNDALKENGCLKAKLNANLRPDGGPKRKRKVSLESAPNAYSSDTSEEEF